MQEPYSDILDATDKPIARIDSATFGIRLVARFLDSFLGVIIAFAIYFILFQIATMSNLDLLQQSTLMNPKLLLGFGYVGLPIIAILIRSIFESSKYQATPAKIIFNIKVVDKHLNRISFSRALGRNCGKFLSGLILYIGYIVALFDHNVQALHDMMASTYVIRNP